MTNHRLVWNKIYIAACVYVAGINSPGESVQAGSAGCITYSDDHWPEEMKKPYADDGTENSGRAPRRLPWDCERRLQAGPRVLIATAARGWIRPGSRRRRRRRDVIRSERRPSPRKVWGGGGGSRRRRRRRVYGPSEASWKLLVGRPARLSSIQDICLYVCLRNSNVIY
jgi:hypothetical protein